MTSAQFIQTWGAKHTCEQAVDAFDFGDKNKEITAALIDVGLDKVVAEVWSQLNETIRNALVTAYNEYREARGVEWLVGSESFQRLAKHLVTELDIDHGELRKIFNGALHKLHFVLQDMKP